MGIMPKFSNFYFQNKRQDLFFVFEINFSKEFIFIFDYSLFSIVFFWRSTCVESMVTTMIVLACQMMPQPGIKIYKKLYFDFFYECKAMQV